MLRPLQPGIGAQQLLGRLLRLLEQAHVPRKVRDAQLGQAVLPLAEEIAGSPQLQVLLRYFKPVRGL